ncbi:MAG TPA: hypothetical protein VKB72_02955 [Steroidobacteraceae bacterium]|nr:hypothetical protein [Steroidobacteraceae bacterium]
MTADELQAAIDRAEGKRRELEAQQPEAKATARLFAMIPKAAALYRQQVALGLNGNPRDASKAKVFLRGLFEGGRSPSAQVRTAASGPTIRSPLRCF